MPKLKTSEEDQRIRNVRAAISRGMEAEGYNEAAVAKVLGVAKRTLQNKRKDPDKFTLLELHKLNRILKFTIDEKQAILG